MTLSTKVYLLYAAISVLAPAAAGAAAVAELVSDAVIPMQTVIARFDPAETSRLMTMNPVHYYSIAPQPLPHTLPDIIGGRPMPDVITSGADYIHRGVMRLAMGGGHRQMARRFVAANGWSVLFSAVPDQGKGIKEYGAERRLYAVPTDVPESELYVPVAIFEHNRNSRTVRYVRIADVRERVAKVLVDGVPGIERDRKAYAALKDLVDTTGKKSKPN